MGSGASTTLELVKEIDNEINNKCASGANIDQSISGVKITSKGCPINVTNDATAKTSCSIDQLADVFSTIADNHKTEASAGFGISFTGDNTKLKEDIKNKLNNKCGSNVNIKQEIDDVDFVLESDPNGKCEAINILNKADGLAQCAISSVLKQTSKSTLEGENKATGKGLFEMIGLSGNAKTIVIIIAVIMGVLILALIGYKIFKKFKN